MHVTDSAAFYDPSYPVGQAPSTHDGPLRFVNDPVLCKHLDETTSGISTECLYGYDLLPFHLLF